MGKDHTLFATSAGAVQFTTKRDDRTYVSIVPGERPSTGRSRRIAIRSYPDRGASLRSGSHFQRGVRVDRAPRFRFSPQGSGAEVAEGDGYGFNDQALGSRIETDRLILRPPHAGDAPRIAEQIGDYNVVRMLSRVPWPYRLEDAEAYVAGVGGRGTLRADQPLAIEHREHGLIGMSGFPHPAGRPLSRDRLLAGARALGAGLRYRGDRPSGA